MEGVRRKIKGWCFRKVVIYFLTYCTVLNTSLPGALAEVVLQPDGIKNGSIIITPLGGGNTQNMTASDGAIGHFSDFDIAAGHLVTCVQPSANANALFRVFSGDGTQILGQFDATGNIYLIDPAGILFGANSQINVNRLIASSLDMSNQDFLDGRYEFLAGADNIGTIVNNGTINAAEGVALIGKKIINTNMITTNPGGFVVMAAGDRVLLGNTGSKIVVEMDSVTLTDPENPDGFGDVVNDNTGGITAPAGTIVLAAGDFFSMALDANPVRIEGGIGRIVQNGNINADGINGDGGRITLTAGDEVVFGSDSLTSANGGISNAGANGGEVIAYASALYSDDAVVDFRAGAEIEVKGGSPSDLTTVDVEATKFEGGLAELSGDHLFFEGTVDATSEPFNVPDPVNAGETLTITPKGGTLHIDPVNLTLADGGIPAEGAAIDTFYEKVLETYSQTGINTILEADYDITVENISDGVIAGGSGDIVLRTAYNKGGIEFKPATDGGPITTTVQTIGGGNIFMLAGSGGIKTGHLQTYEDSANPGRIRIFTNNGGSIEVRSLTVDGGNDVEVSVIASGDLVINGNVITNTNKVPANYDKTGRAYICLVSDNGSVNILGAVEVEAHGKDQTIAQIHICADNTVSVHTGNGRIQAIAKTSSTGTADADVKIHAGSEALEAITVIRSSGGNPIRIQANTSGATIGPLDFTGAETEYEQTNGGAHVFVQIADAWLAVCPDCPTPPDLPPPIEFPKRAPIAVDDDYSIGKGDVILIILSEDGVLVNGEDGNGEDYDPDGDIIIAILLGGGTTAQNGTVFLQEDGGFEYTPPAEKIYDDGYGSDAEGDYALFIDTFIYYVQDEGDLTSSEATVTITSKNYIPVAQPDSYEVVHNVSLSPTVDQGIITGVDPAVNGDTDVDGDLLTPYLPGDVTIGSTALGGTVTLNPDGSFSYDPPVDTVGTDSFTYYATDGYNNSESVEVTIDLTNTQPIARPDSYDVVHNVNLTPAVDEGIITGVVPAVNGDSDADGDLLIPFLPGDVATGATDQGGQITLNSNGSFSYDPPADWVGIDSFTYYVTDGYSNSEPVQVTIEVTNTLPIAQPDSYQVVYGKPLSPTVDQGIITGVVPVENGDYDLDPNDSLIPYLPGALTTGPTDLGGTVKLNSDGSFTYTPPAGFSGTDSFTYYVTDGYGNSESVQVTMHVDSPPPALPASYIQPAPGLQRDMIEISGCPALIKWVASELGTDERKIQIWMADSLASPRDIQPCDACAKLKDAATFLQDLDGTRVAALAQVVNGFASSTTPPTKEQMALIADAIANNIEGNRQYTAAREYLNALAEYVGILNSEMGYSADESIQFAIDNYVGQLVEGEDMGVAAFVVARLVTLRSSL